MDLNLMIYITLIIYLVVLAILINRVLIKYLDYLLKKPPKQPPNIQIDLKIPEEFKLVTQIKQDLEYLDARMEKMDEYEDKLKKQLESSDEKDKKAFKHLNQGLDEVITDFLGGEKDEQ